MKQQLTEGTTTFVTDSDEKITRDMMVFYNPVMKFNRDLTLAVLLSMEEKDLRLGFPMEASGVRVARILHELVAPGYVVPKIIALNDISATAIEYGRKNVSLNKGIFDNIHFSTLEASLFLKQSTGFDYIDIDPFGTPNPFLDAAVRCIVHDGILAVTATDTAALAGTYPSATARKYWSVPSRTWVMHEIGLRILIRKVQLIAAQYDKVLLPVLSVATDHYYRVFFRCKKENPKALLKNHQCCSVCTQCMQTAVVSTNISITCDCNAQVTPCGPLWIGALHDKYFAQQMFDESAKLDEKTAKELQKILMIILDECRIATVGFIDLHEFASRHKVPAPKTEDVLQKLGEHACRTHINGAGVKTDLKVDEFLQRIK